MGSERALTLGRRAGVLNLQLESGQAFVDQLQLQAGPEDPDGKPEGTPIDWPTGTTGELILTNRRSGEQHVWPAVIEGSHMSWSVRPVDVDKIAQAAHAELVVKYPDSTYPWLFREGDVSWR